MFDLFSAPDLNGALPKGSYQAIIVGSELKDTKSGTGKYLNIEFKILSPSQYAGRSVFNMYNVINENSKAQQIGLGQLKELGKVVLTEAEMKSSSPTMFNGKQVEISLDIKTDDYGDKNVIKKYSKIDPTKTASSSPW